MPGSFSVVAEEDQVTIWMSVAGLSTRKIRWMGLLRYRRASLRVAVRPGWRPFALAEAAGILPAASRPCAFVSTVSGKRDALRGCGDRFETAVAQEGGVARRCDEHGA